MEPLVFARGLGKRYKVYADSRGRLVEWITAGRCVRHHETWALRDVTLDVGPGEVLGIVGSNGAGKTTLLKVLTGVTVPTTGTFGVRGRVGSLLQLGAGFHPAFSGRDNIFMNAALLGLAKREVKERFQEIAEFAELGDYLYQPVRTYSSGMVMRLGFAVAMMSEPEVLALDEILAVGDQRFQRKCMERVREIRRAGTSILFVSHSIYHVRQLCDRAIWIDDGRIVAEGDPLPVTYAYVSHQLARAAREKPAGGPPAAPADPAAARLEAVEIAKAGGREPVNVVKTGNLVDFIVRFRNPGGAGAYHVAILVSRNDDVETFSACSKDSGRILSGEEDALVMRVRMRLTAGEYAVSAWLLDAGDGSVAHEWRSCAEFRVEYDGIEKGVLLADCRWRTPKESAWTSRSSA